MKNHEYNHQLMTEVEIEDLHIRREELTKHVRKKYKILHFRGELVAQKYNKKIESIFVFFLF